MLKLYRFRRLFGWNRISYVLSLFFLVDGLIVVVWWPLAEEVFSYWGPDIPWWQQMDWLLMGDFLVMSVLIMAGADFKSDIWIAAVGLAGGWQSKAGGHRRVVAILHWRSPPTLDPPGMAHCQPRDQPDRALPPHHAAQTSAQALGRAVLDHLPRFSRHHAAFRLAHDASPPDNPGNPGVHPDHHQPNQPPHHRPDLCRRYQPGLLP